MKNIRKGKGYSWSENSHGPGGTDRCSSGYTIDNLDTKKISDAINNYEEVFIRMRELLTEKPWCCDSQEDVLYICQVVSDNLRENLLIRKDVQ